MSLTTMWLILCGLCLIIEIFTVSFLMFFPGVGAFFAFLAGLLGATIPVQCIIFAVSSALMIIFIRPLVTKLFKTRDTAMNSSALIGKKGIVLKDIKGDDKVGQVKVAGEIWSAICEEGVFIEKDSKIIVLAISGVKLVVKEISNKEV